MVSKMRARFLQSLTATVTFGACAITVLIVAQPTSALAQGKAAATCVNKAGQGTNTTEDGAKFQAYEAVLQATDWGMWASWISGSARIGDAPGYKVSNLRTKCDKGSGLGYTCLISARLCK